VIKVERAYSDNTIYLDDGSQCDMCSSLMDVGSDPEAIALAVALVQATPEPNPPHEGGATTGRLMLRDDAIRYACAIIRAAAKE
jgi:hypothetical protein